jgi:transposase
MSERISEVVRENFDQLVRIWVLDEHYLHEAFEVDGAHKVELRFTPSINQDVHAVFLKQTAESDPDALHVVVMDQAGFHMKQEDRRVPSNICVLPLPPYCPELNPAESFGRVVKAPTVNRIYGSLEKLENDLIALARGWSNPSKVASLVHQWMRDQVNATAAT